MKNEVAAGMVDRLLDIKRKYEEVVEVGSGAGYVVRELGEETGTKRVVMTDNCEAMLRRDEGHASYDGPPGLPLIPSPHLTLRSRLQWKSRDS